MLIYGDIKMNKIYNIVEYYQYKYIEKDKIELPEM